MEVSLDGGASYAPAQGSGDGWRFTLPAALASQSGQIALVRAVDLWGNVSAMATPVSDEAVTINAIYLPAIQRTTGVQSNAASPPVGAVDAEDVQSGESHAPDLGDEPPASEVEPGSEPPASLSPSSNHTSLPSVTR
jgi:hypothetical protein